jgi:hypothetical protein
MVLLKLDLLQLLASGQLLQVMFNLLQLLKWRLSKGGNDGRSTFEICLMGSHLSNKMALIGAILAKLMSWSKQRLKKQSVSHFVISHFSFRPKMPRVLR